MQEVPPHDHPGNTASSRRYGAPGDEDLTARQARAHRLRRAWQRSLDPGQRSALLSWTSFTVTFAAVRALTHWIKAGHGPSGGGMSLNGRHFHHYNIGIVLLGAIGAIAVRGAEHHRRHPLTAIGYGVGTALIVDELALLLDLEDVYWSSQGRESVDAAVSIIGAGGVAIAGTAFWPEARRALR